MCVCVGGRGGARIKECLQSVSHSSPLQHIICLFTPPTGGNEVGVMAAHLLSMLQQRDEWMRDDMQLGGHETRV